MRHRLTLEARTLGVIATIAICACHKASTDPLDSGPVIPGSTNRIFLEVSTSKRQYVLHIPWVTATRKNPLVILLHGSGQDGEAIRAYSEMDSLADSLKFVVAYPDATGEEESDWNAGNCCGTAFQDNVDDIGFVRQTISDVSARVRIDATKVYVGGFSDGARMAYRVACEMASQVAAVAVVSGSLVTGKCAPSRTMPVIAFHGTADQSISYNEASATVFPRNPPSDAASLPPSVRFWMAVNSCAKTTVKQITANVIRNTETGCKADVVFYSMVGGDHSWPAKKSGDEISASPLIAAFFLAHKLP